MVAIPLDKSQIHLLLFELDGQLYGVDVDQVEALVEGECCDGLWSYEGQDVPTQCLALWVGLEQPEKAPTRMLLTQSGGELRGFLVDTPRDIATLSVEDIFPIPNLIQRVLGHTPLWGVGRTARGLLLLVDLAAAEGMGTWKNRPRVSGQSTGGKDGEN